MPDNADIAQEISERLLEDALTDYFKRPRLGAARSALIPTHCRDCGEEIPLRRRQLMPGCLRCTDCQSLLENWRAL